MKRLFYLLLFYFLHLSVMAQVTIGSNYKPNAGALLDLKEEESSNALTATRGLLLPKVSLASSKKLYPMYSYAGTAPPSSKDLADHTGLIVQNVNDTEGVDNMCPLGLSSGLYVWSGEQWDPLTEGAVDYLAERLADADIMVDDRDKSKPETYYVGDFEEAGWWMLENLRAIKMPDGTPIDKGKLGNYEFGIKYNYPAAVTGGTANPTIDGDVTLFENNPKLGILYSWEAATNGKARINNDDSATDTGIQGVCPEGWHLPSRNEWIELLKVIDDSHRHNLCVYSTDPLLGELDPQLP